ncbi:MAG: hypothetical protein KF895_15380 [Parvibaculum sp.]|uniref:hypothetical protein n=1 Tax=Chelatococcus sp. TaxID=1953771 RepID=UPI001EB3E39F|nr:hypothetical protein [Chelatococcus sp.]MBX3506861.1 hypothetical protein [Parvibaculum sp.]MBX3545567.1 hypothetical protein [Chelatococcus sp.]
MLAIRSLLPLLHWQDTREAAGLRIERDRLSRKIAGLKPNSHKRIVCEARLAEITSQLLRLESEKARECP